MFHAELRVGLFERFRGPHVDPGKCTLEWNHEDKVEVGGASVATLHVSRWNCYSMTFELHCIPQQLLCKDSTPYKLQASDVVRVSIKHKATDTAVPHAVEPAPPTNHSKLRLSFTTRLAGVYTMEVYVNGLSISGSPFSRTYLPGTHGTFNAAK